MAKRKLSQINKLAISINQDPIEQGKRIKKDGDVEAWVKQLKNDQRAVLLLNRNRNESIKYSLNLNDLSIKPVRVTDVYASSKLKAKKGKFEFTIKPHACIFLKIE